MVFLGTALSGTVDETHYAALVHALHYFATYREIHLDLSGLGYCGVACLCATLHIFGWDRMPGLSMSGEA